MSAGHEHASEDRSPDAVSRDVRGVARLLDKRGARLGASGLSPSSLDRIFAASDLQLPVSGGAADRAVIRRIADRPGPRPAILRGLRGSPFRIAASIAALVGLGVGAYVATHFAGRGASTPPERSVVAAAAPPAAAPRVDPTYFDLVLASASVVSVPSPKADATTPHADLGGDLDGPRVVLAGVALPEGDEPHGGSFLDGVSTTYDDLSGEFAALCGLAPAVR